MKTKITVKRSLSGQFADFRNQIIKLSGRSVVYAGGEEFHAGSNLSDTRVEMLVENLNYEVTVII